MSSFSGHLHHLLLLFLVMDFFFGGYSDNVTRLFIVIFIESYAAIFSEWPLGRRMFNSMQAKLGNIFNDNSAHWWKQRYSGYFTAMMISATLLATELRVPLLDTLAPADLADTEFVPLQAACWSGR
jgi:hypothetical protein